VTARQRIAAYVVGVVAAALFTGTIVVSIGIGTELTAINTVMSPLVCPGDRIVPAWEYRGRPQLASGPELRTRWICVDEASGRGHVAGYRTIFTAGAVYGLILSAIALAVLWRRGVFARA
jgi:hypothetical protein